MKTKEADISEGSRLDLTPRGAPFAVVRHFERAIFAQLKPSRDYR
jgi:hypothetical protein